MKIRVFLTVVMIITIMILSAIAVNAETDSIFTYAVYDGEAIITEVNKSASGWILIPSEINGMPVTSIGTSAFSNCKNVTSVAIPESVTSIGGSAFYGCNSLTSITIPESVTNIGGYAFSHCSSLTNITIPGSITTIENGTFDSCGLRDVTIPEGITSIGRMAFVSCHNLTNIIIPDSVTSIGGYAFSYCRNLTSISIPESVNSLEDGTFSGCSSLTSITIPNSVTNIGNSAFGGCSSLTNIDVDENNSCFSSYDDVLFNKEKTNLILYPKGELRTSYFIPEGVTSIENAAFSNCSNLTSITLPESVTSIGDSAFYGCNSLTSITLPENVTNIGNSAFSHCSNLTSITLPEGVASIGEKLFYSCSCLIGITIPDSIRWIHEDAFLSCVNLKYVYFDGTKKQWKKILISDGNAYLLNANINYKKVACKFLNDDGKIVEEKIVDYGTTIELPEAPTKPSTQQYTYTFAEWEGYTDGMTAVEDVIFKAKYTESINQYTYKFIDDGAVIEEKTVDYGTVIEKPEQPSDREPYVFDYWDGYFEDMTIEGNIEFRAVYKYKTYSITIQGLEGNVNVTYNDEFSLSVQEKGDYVFDGYYTEENGRGEKITDENGQSIKVYSLVGNLTVYPYFISIYMDKIEFKGDDFAIFGEEIVEQVVFATDEKAQYLLVTVKYPETIKLDSIIAKDFVEATKDSEITKDGYKYLSLTCIYDYSGTYIPQNEAVILFELRFSIPVSSSTGDVNISIYDAVLVGDIDCEIEYKSSKTITVLPKLAESIEVMGAYTIDGSSKYTAIVKPDYTSNKEIIWSVDDETTASITDDGVLTPIKNGVVTVTATAKDGSEVYGSKTVNITAYAIIDDLDFGEAVSLVDFDPYNREYTIYVKKDATTVTLKPSYTGGTLRVVENGASWLPGRAKTFELTSDETVIVLNRDNVENMTASTYKITVAKYEGTQTTLSEDGSKFDVNVLNLESGNVIILALYKDDEVVETHTEVYNGRDVSYTTDEEYDKVKIMAWSNLLSMIPVAEAEVIER